jgi:hypothetical protein
MSWARLASIAKTATHNDKGDTVTTEDDIRQAVQDGNLYKAHTLAYGLEWVHEEKARELGLDFGELCAPWCAKWGQDLIDGINEYSRETV